MLKAAAERGWLNEKDAVLEALLCLKRAGSGAPARGLAEPRLLLCCCCRVAAAAAMATCLHDSCSPARSACTLPRRQT